MPYLYSNIIFVDTSAIIGIFNKNDQHHEIAQLAYGLLKEKGYTFIITNHVIAEAHALILREKRPHLGFTLLDILYDDKEFTRIFIEEDIENFAYSILPKYTDKCWSFTDMTSFIIMEKLNLQYYFSFDGDFKEINKFSDILNMFK